MNEKVRESERKREKERERKREREKESKNGREREKERERHTASLACISTPALIREREILVQFRCAASSKGVCSRRPLLWLKSNGRDSKLFTFLRLLSSMASRRR